METPQITNSTGYLNASYSGDMSQSEEVAWVDAPVGAELGQAFERLARRMPSRVAEQLAQSFQTTTQPNQTNIMPNQTKRRIVQIFIADPDERVALADSLLYQSEKPFLTDLTDQELFFEVPIKELLDKHNAKRLLTEDKKALQTTVVKHLEPIRVRDLRMTIVTVAEF